MASGEFLSPVERTLSLKRFRGKDESAESTRRGKMPCNISRRPFPQDEFGFDDELASFVSRMVEWYFRFNSDRPLSLSLLARNSYLDTKRWSEFERWKSDFENSTFAEILADPRVPQGRFNAGIRATRFSRKEHAVRSLSRAANNKNHAPFSRCLFFPRLDFDRPSPQTIQRETAFESSFKLSSSLRRNIVVRSN